MELTLERAEQLVGLPIGEWDGNCHAVSAALAGAVGGVVRRGWFLGEIDPEAYFAGRPSQHSWIELPDGRVCDPTRTAFTAGERWPLWVGPGDDYDIGGCRSQAPKGSPPSFYESAHEPVELELESVEYLAGLLGAPPEFYGEDWLMLSPEQVLWLGSLPIKDRDQSGTLHRFFAAEVYEALLRAGQRHAIPVDRLEWILGPEAASIRPTSPIGSLIDRLVTERG